MKHRILYIISIALLAVTGCASSTGTSKTETPAEQVHNEPITHEIEKATPKSPADLERDAQTARYDGLLEESNNIYRQLIELNPKSFGSVLYQHEIMCNAQAQSEPWFLAGEVLKTIWLLERAEVEHFKDATPEAIAQEKDLLEKFIYDIADGYGQLVRSSELYVWLGVFYIRIWEYYFPESETVHDNEGEAESKKEMKHIPNDENVFRYAYRYKRKDYYSQMLSDYYDHIIDLYDQGIITEDMFHPINILKIDIMDLKLDVRDAVIKFALNNKSDDFGNLVNLYKNSLKVERNLTIRDECYFVDRRLECYKRYFKVGERYLKLRMKNDKKDDKKNIVSVAEEVDLLKDLGYSYHSFNFDEKAISSLLAGIDYFVDSNISIGSNREQYDSVYSELLDLEYSVGNSVYLLKNIYINLERYQELEELIPKIKRIIKKIGFSGYGIKQMDEFVKKYEKNVPLCKMFKQQNNLEKAEQCYKGFLDESSSSNPKSKKKRKSKKRKNAGVEIF